MNFRNPNKKRLQFSIDPRNIRTSYLKIIEFSILPLPTPSPLRRIESINMPANELDQAGRPATSFSTSPSTTNPSTLLIESPGARAHTHTHTYEIKRSNRRYTSISTRLREGRERGG